MRSYDRSKVGREADLDQFEQVRREPCKVVRRLIREYGRAEDEVFPTGSYFKGGSYGSDVSLPIAFREVNNSLFDGSVCNVREP